MPLAPGDILQNRYRISLCLGQGGMGAVYLAADLRLRENPCAVKENAETSPEAQRQFEEEAVLLARLSHPNLPRVFDHFIEPSGRQYLVMEYVEGQNLETLRHGGPQPEAQALAWMRPIFSAVEYLHSRGVLHRDIKPGNIRLCPDGQTVLVDFGIAKVHTPGQMTRTGARATTSGYAPPEQYTGGTDERTDVYALGATLYCLLAGQPPPLSPDLAVGRAVLAPPRDLNPAVSAGTEQIILKAMTILQGGRYQTVAEMRLALYAQAVPPQVATPPSPTLPAPPPVVTPPALPEQAPPTVPAPVPRAMPVAPAAEPVSWWRHRVAGAAALALPIGVVAIIAAWVLSGGLAPRPPLPAVTPATASPSHTPTAGPATPTAAATGLPTSTSSAPTSVTRLPTPRPGLATSTPVPPTRTPIPPPPPPKAPTAGALGIGSLLTSSKDGMVAVYVPAGDFLMGSADSDAAAEPDEKPQHTVYLDAYWMDRTEVTNAMYARCVQAGACQSPREVKSWTRSSYFGNPAYDAYPVIYVSWTDAISYCVWAGRKLPTEAEWEKAARGTDGRLYPWGSEWDAGKLNSDYAGYSDSTSVGSFPTGASPYGALDMAGNVWEWVFDRYGPTYYAASPSKNPTGPSSGATSVLRGGSSSSRTFEPRAANRIDNQPSLSFADTGFRCARSP